MTDRRRYRTGLVLGVLFVTGLAALTYWMGQTETAMLKRRLAVLAPYSLHMALLFFLGGAVASRRLVARSFEGCGHAWWALPLIGLFVVGMLPPRTHRIYYDEDIYQNVAQNILWHGRAEMCNEGVIADGVFECRESEYNKEPHAFPFLLSLLFRFTGVHEAASHVLNHLLFAVGVLASYWIGLLLFDNRQVATGAAVVFLLTPMNLLWGATIAAEPGAAAAAGVALAVWLLFLREMGLATGAMAVGAIALAVQWRPESILLVAVVGVVTIIVQPGRLRRREFYVVALLLFVLLLPHLVHLWVVRGEGWGASESGKFSWQYVADNLKTNVAFYFEGNEHPIYFTLLAVLGLAVGGRWKEKSSLLVWFLLFFGVFIPFHAGSYRYGADVRFSLLSFMPLAILGGRGAGWLAEQLGERLTRASRWLRAVPLVAAIYCFSGYLPLVRSIGREAWAARADHDIALDLLEQVPSDSMVLTHNPGMLQVMGQSAVQASIATTNPTKVDHYFKQFAGGVYFHYNFWCNIQDPVQNAFCNRILADYPTQVVEDRSAGFYRYILYRLMPKRSDSGT